MLPIFLRMQGMKICFLVQIIPFTLPSIFGIIWTTSLHPINTVLDIRKSARQRTYLSHICSGSNPESGSLMWWCCVFFFQLKRSCSHHGSGRFNPQMPCDRWLSDELAEASRIEPNLLRSLWNILYLISLNPFDFRPPPRFIATATPSDRVLRKAITAVCG